MAVVACGAGDTGKDTAEKMVAKHLALVSSPPYRDMDEAPLVGGVPDVAASVAKAAPPPTPLPGDPHSRFAKARRTGLPPEMWGETWDERCDF